MAQTIRKLGVIGAGQMGNGISHVCALAGISVVLHDVSPARLKEAIATINGNMARQVARKRITEEDKASALKRISTSETLDGLSDCDLVIDHAALSRRHAQLRVRPLTIQDLGSTNGIRVGAQTLNGGEPVALQTGDSFHIGPFAFMVV